MSPHNFPYPVLLVDDEPEILSLTKTTLQCEGIDNIVTLKDSRKVLPFLQREKVSAVVVDLMMPYLSGLELLKAIIADFPAVPVIVMTALDEVETAVECLKNGAFDYLLKPVEPNSLVSAVARAIKMNSLQKEISTLKNYLLSGQLQHSEAFTEIITNSKKMRAIFQYTEVVAASRQSILITGETGTGKELIARAIHKLSRRSGDFIALNVAGLDDSAFSDTLFGHRRGAYTGAEQNREGLISKAAGGTLFLDEIGDLSMPSQVKLLRLLQEEEFYPLGSDAIRSCDARIIVATNHHLESTMDKGAFRRDLYYRLCTHNIALPPLRERLEDIPLLLNHFLKEAAVSFNKPKPVASPEVAEYLTTMQLSGNIRELKAIIWDAVARHDKGLLSFRHFPAIQNTLTLPLKAVAKKAQGEESDPLLALFGKIPSIAEMEDYLVARALKVSGGRAAAAATMLGISRQALYKKVKPEKPLRAVRGTVR